MSNYENSYAVKLGSYTLSESPRDDYGDTQQTAGIIAVGGSINGTLESYGDSDWFNVALKAGFSYEFDLISNPTTGVDPEFELLAATGATVVDESTSSNGLAIITYNPTITGTYDIAVSSPNLINHEPSSEGAYQVVSSPQDPYGDTAATAGTLAIGGTLAGSIDASYDIDWFGVTLTAGHSYQFAVQSVVTGGFSPTLGLRSPTGAVAVSSQSSSNGSVAISYTPSVSGVYDVVVAGNSSVKGSYDVSALSTGVSTVDAGSGATAQLIPAGNNYITTEGANTIAASSGSTTVSSATGNPVIFGGGTSLDFVGGSGSATVIGGTANTVTGGSGNLLLFAVSGATFKAGAGAATIIGGQGGLNAALGAGGGEAFGGTGTNTLSGSGGSASTTTALVAAGNGDVISVSGAGTNILVAAAGAETLAAAQSSGLDVFYGGSGADSMVGGTGDNFFLVGTGNDTLVAGGSFSQIDVVAGSTSRTTTIDNFSSSSYLALFGYGSNPVGVAQAAAVTSGGSTTLSLSDGTTLILAGVTQLNASNII